MPLRCSLRIRYRGTGSATRAPPVSPTLCVTNTSFASRASFTYTFCTIARPQQARQ